MSASAGRITAWDIPDSMRLGHDYAAEVALRVISRSHFNP